jgi:glycerol-1-phosphate dehydrogenase [NAD(P)+]
MKKTIFITDEKIWQNCRKFFAQDFLENFDEILFLKDPKADENNLKIIEKSIKTCNFILALGSGTVNDLCKFTSVQKNIPYAIFASAPSMNGYLSRNASITIAGHKKTFPATLPEAVFCDLRILKSAPLNLIKAGVGDSLCFYSCWFDWYLSHKIFGTKFDLEPFAILQKKIDFLLKNFHKFSLRDEDFIQLLIEILLLSGEGMTIAQGSYPASQSEHLIAHAIEMKYPKISAKKLHGEMIAVTTLTSAKIQKDLLKKNDISPADNIFDLDDFFDPKIVKECKEEYLKKLSLKPKKIEWPKLKKEFKKIHLDESKIRQIFDHFKIKYSAKSLGLPAQKYQDCVAKAKFIRNRVTCLDFR